MQITAIQINITPLHVGDYNQIPDISWYAETHKANQTLQQHSSWHKMNLTTSLIKHVSDNAKIFTSGFWSTQSTRWQEDERTQSMDITWTEAEKKVKVPCPLCTLDKDKCHHSKLSHQVQRTVATKLHTQTQSLCLSLQKLASSIDVSLALSHYVFHG